MVSSNSLPKTKIKSENARGNKKQLPKSSKNKSQRKIQSPSKQSHQKAKKAPPTKTSKSKMKKLTGKGIQKLKSQQNSAKLMEKFISKSGTRPKPQSKASAKVKDIVSEGEEDNIENNNNNINNNNNNNNNFKEFSPNKEKNCVGYDSNSKQPLSYEIVHEDIMEDPDEEIGLPLEEELDFSATRPEANNPISVVSWTPANKNAQNSLQKHTLFECKICFQLFPNRYFHRKHMLRDHEDQLYECRVCSFNSVHPEKLKNHIIKLHVSRKEKTEQSDGEELQKELENLIEKKVPRKVIMEDGVPLGRDANKKMRFVCALCSRRYSSKYALERHVRCHTLEKPYHCDVCDFSSSYKEHMMRHITSVHLIVHSNEPRLKYVPKKRRSNDEDDSNDDDGGNEAKKRRNILRKRFECAVCGLKSTHKIDLMAHIKEKHPNAHIESLKNNDGSKVHLIVTVAKKPRVSKKLTIQCTYCSLIFHDTWKYKVHLRSHTGIKPFRCSVCSFRATSKMTVRDHIHRKHSDSLDSAKIFLRTVGIDGAVEEVQLALPWREFKCEYCSEVLQDNYNLKLHKQKEHKDARPFSCTLCDEKCLTKAAMIKHCLETHEDSSLNDIILHYGKPAKISSGKLPSCEFCNKIFAYQSQLNIHLKLHTGERTFQCDHCQYKTNSKNLLTNHLLKMHFGAAQSEKRSKRKQEKPRKLQRESSHQGSPKSKELLDKDTETRPISKVLRKRGPKRKVRSTAESSS